jgi:hypothetical protein
MVVPRGRADLAPPQADWAGSVCSGGGWGVGVGGGGGGGRRGGLGVGWDCGGVVGATWNGVGDGGGLGWSTQRGGWDSDVKWGEIWS